MPENPFVVGNPVSGSLFGGREDDIKRIVGRLKTMQSTSVVGERRIGKTSLLFYLSDRSEMEKRGFKTDEYAFLYFSFEGHTDITPTRFWKRILQQLSRVCKDEEIVAEINTIRRPEEIDGFDLEDLFFRIKELGLKIVLLFDEFEYVTQNERFKSDFFGYLRSLSISRDAELGIITATRQQLTEISQADMLGSPFFNIFDTVLLKPFNEDDARKLIQTALSTDSLSFDNAEVDFLIELTGCHPFFFQMGCRYLYDAYRIKQLIDNRQRAERLEAVKEQCKEQAAQHLKYYWEKSDDTERILLSTIAVLGHSDPIDRKFDLDNLKRFYQESGAIISELEDRGLVLKRNREYRIFSPIFDDWIIGEIINEKTPEQSYDEWLKDNTGQFAGSRRLLNSAREIFTHIDPKYRKMVIKWLSKTENRQKILGWLAKAGLLLA